MEIQSNQLSTYVSIGSTIWLPCKEDYHILQNVCNSLTIWNSLIWTWNLVLWKDHCLTAPSMGENLCTSCVLDGLPRSCRVVLYWKFKVHIVVLHWKFVQYTTWEGQRMVTTKQRGLVTRNWAKLAKSGDNFKDKIQGKARSSLK